MNPLRNLIRPDSPDGSHHLESCNLAWNKCSLLVRFLSIAMAVFVLAPSSVFAASQTWDGGGGNANWSTQANWVGDPTAPGATTGNSSTDVATFNSAIANTWGNSGTPIVIDSGRNIGTILFDTVSVGSYTIGSTTGPALIISNAGAITMNGTVAASQTINAPLTLTGNSGTALTITNNASSTSHILTIGGAINSSATTGTTTLSITGSNTGNNVITGNITNGSGSNVVAMQKLGGGTWILSGGAGNTFSGGVWIRQGIISVNSMASLGLGTLGIGSSSQSANFYYTGSGETTATVVNLAGTTAAASIFANNTSGTLNFTSDFTATGLGAKILNLRGTGGAAIAGRIVDSGNGATSIEKRDAGIWTLSGNNTYSGGITLFGGTLNINHANALGATAGNLTISGGTIDNTSASVITNAGNNAISIGANFAFGGTTNDLNLGIGAVSGDLTRTITLNGSGRTLTLGGTWSNTVSNAARTLTVNGTGNTLSLGGISLTPAAGVATTLTIAGTANVNVTGAITDGSGTAGSGLTKSGAGTLTLSGVNTYTGTTTINAGNLTLTGGSAISDTGAVTLANTAGAILHVAQSETIGQLSGGGASGGDISIAAGQSLTLNMAAGGSFAGSISGSGGLIRTGFSNVYTLSGTNTYSGGTTIRQGYIVLGADNAIGTGNLTFDTTGISYLRLNGRNQTITGLSMSGASNNSYIENNAATNSVLTVNLADGVTSSSNSFLTFRNGSTGTLALVKSGNGTLDFSTYDTMSYSGGLTVNGGTFSYSNTAALGNSTAGSAITLGGGALNYSGSGSVTIANNATLTAGTTSALNNAAGTVTVSGTIGGTGNLTKSGAGNLTLSSANTYQGGTNINAGTLQIGNAAGLGVGGTISFGGGTLQYGAGITDDLSSRFSTAANQAYSIDTGANNIAFASALSSSGGTLAKSGAGNLTLTMANSYTGATTVNAGALNIQNANALGTTDGGTTVSSGAALQLQGGITVGAEALSLTGTGVSTDGALRNISGSNTYGGAITLAGATRINSDANLLTLSGGISGTQNLTIGGAGNTTISNAIATSTGTLTKDGAGMLILSANNTYTGATAVGTSGGANAGTLQLSGLGKISTAATTIFGGTLDLNGTNQSITTLSLGGGASGSTAAVTTGSGTLALGGTVTFSATNNADGATISGNLDLGGATRTFTIGDSSAAVADLTVSAAISNGPLTKNGAGTLVLSGINTYTGTTTISAGNLTVSSGSAISDSGSVALTNAAGAILHVAQSEIIGNLSGGGASGGDISIASGQTLTANQSSAATFAGIISGSGGFAKNGTGTLTLSNINTYQGATTINAGAIALTGSNTASATTINSGGTLIGTGSAGAVTVNSGGLIGAGSAAATVGTLTVGSLTLNGGSGYTWDLGNVTGAAGTNWDLVTAASTTINADSTNKFTIFITGNPTGWSPGTTYSTGWNILQWGTLSAFDADAFAVNAANFTGSAPTGSWTFQNSGGFLNLSYTAPAASAVWTVGSGNWSTASNWQGNAVPSNTSPLDFSGGGGVSTNNGALTTISGITFTSSASGSYTLNGTALNIAGGISNLSNSTQTVAMDTTMTAAQSFNAVSANLTVSGAINNGGGMLTTTGNNTVSISGSISGSGGITKNGTGTLILSGSNSYTGNTTVSAGDLNIQNANALGTTAGGTIVNSGGSLRLQGDITVAGEALSLSGNGSNLDGTGALRNISGNNTWTGNITSTGSTTRITSDSGLLTLSGGLFNNNPSNTVTFTGAGSTIVSGNMSSAGGGFTMSGSGTLTLTGNNTFTGLLSATQGTVSISSIGNVGVASAAGAGSTINIGGTALSGILLYTGSAATSNKTINLATGSATYSSTITQNGTGLLKFTSDFTATVGGNKTLILNGSGLGEIAGAIVNNTGNLTTLTKNGSGTWTLSGTNTYTGATTVNAGTLQFAKTASLYNGTTASWTPPNIIVNSGGTLALNVGGAGEFTSANVDTIDSLGGASNGFRNNSTLALDTTNAGGTFTHSGNISNPNSGANVLNFAKLGTGTLVLTGNNTYNGTTTISAGALEIGSTGRLGGGSYSGNIANSGTFIYSGANSQTLSGVISGNGALTQNGSGTLTLSGSSNTYSGATTISAGNISISSVSALGSTSGVNLANATALIYTGGSAATLDRAITVTGGTGTLRNNGGVLTLTGGLSKNGTTLTFDSGTFNVNTVGISGSAANSDLVIDGATVNLNVANTYNGPTSIIDGGILNANVANALPTANGRTAISIDATGTGSSNLALGASQSIASLAGNTTSTVSLGSNSLTIGSSNNATSTTYAGRITGASNSALVKDGTSTQVLSGNNTGFTGTTTINNGTLTANSANALGGTTTIDVNGGSLLVAVANAVNSNANINLGGGTLAVSGNFTQNVGALTLSANSVIDFSGFSGILRFSGLSWASGASNATLAIWNWSGTTAWGTQINNYQNPSQLVFTNSANLTTSDLAKINFYSDSGFNSIGSGFIDSSFIGGGNLIIAVPEPETYITAVALLLGFTFYQIRLARHGLLSRLTFLQRRKS